MKCNGMEPESCGCVDCTAVFSDELRKVCEALFDAFERDALAQRVYDRIAELGGLIALVRDQYLDEDADGWSQVKPLMAELTVLSELAWPSNS